MGIIKRAGDLVYTFRFLRLLTMKFEDTEAYKRGIIDDEGKRLKSYNLDTMQEREDYNNFYTPFHRLVFNIKKLMAKAPGGGSKLASYAAALYLIKETNDRIRTLVIIVMCSAHHVSAAKRRGVLEINVPRFCCRHPHVLRHNGTTSFGKQFVDLRLSLLQHI